MDDQKTNQLVKLYDPHPGFAGAVVPLPTPMKNVADGLAGKTMSLEEVLEQMSPAASKCGGSLEIVEEYQYIGFLIQEKSGRTHYFRLIRYCEA